jgi:ribonuclease PH
MPPSRSYDRAPGDLRPIRIETGFVRTADGSALYSQGETRVICTASVVDSVPRWMEGRGRGWVTAEYSMLPASTGPGERKDRDVKRGRQDGRSVEIQRLIGRSLPGGFIALRLALEGLVNGKKVERLPLNGSIAAVSVGLVDGDALCDLDYSEDSAAEVDANVVMTGEGELVEVQATAERTPLSRASLDELLAIAERAIAKLREAQERAAERAAGGTDKTDSG